jgi:hypothetical protein
MSATKIDHEAELPVDAFSGHTSDIDRTQYNNVSSQNKFVVVYVDEHLLDVVE